MWAIGILCLGNVIRVMAQTAPASICVSWSTATVATSSAASSTADSNAPSCGLHGWDKGTNIGYYVGSQYASFTACNALCNNQLACLSFTYLASGPYCIIYDYLVEGNMTPDSSSPYVFFDKGGICAGTAVVASTSAAIPVAAGTTASSSQAATITTSRTSTTLATSSTIPSSTRYTTLFSSTTTYSTSTYTTSTCTLGLGVCLAYSTFATTTLVPVATSVAYTTKTL